MAQLQQYAKLFCIVDGSLLEQCMSVEVESPLIKKLGEVKITSAVPEEGIECDLAPGTKCVLHVLVGDTVKKFEAVVKNNSLSKHVDSSAIHTLVFKVKDLPVDPDVLMISKLLLQLRK